MPVESPGAEGDAKGDREHEEEKAAKWTSDWLSDTAPAMSRPARRSQARLAGPVGDAARGRDRRRRSGVGVAAEARPCLREWCIIVAMELQQASGFERARDLLLSLRDDYTAALESFSWPELGEFNWAIDHFDALGSSPSFSERTALRIAGEGRPEESLSYSEMVARSNQVANRLREVGVGRGDRVVVMLGNQVELWETVLAAMKLGAIVIPASTLVTTADLRDWVLRASASHAVVRSADAARVAGALEGCTRLAAGDAVPGWLSYADADEYPTEFVPEGRTMASDPLLFYFTSGTTAEPKLVEHTHASYPVGHLSTLYWIGIRPGDVHLNISSPGWAKHAWSSVFAPWNAGACIFVHDYSRFDAAALMGRMEAAGVTTFCAPPTVWRMLIQADLALLEHPPREAVAAGEPLNPEVIEQVRRAWGVTVRDGYGQTETTAQIANTPGQELRLGSMGRPLPGYHVELLDPLSGEPSEEGEICLELSRRPLGLMTGYRDAPELMAEVMRDGYYHTGDVARRDEDGYITYVGRADDVFKASDYRISPFELESILLKHETVAEAAVVPSPDPVRLAVPKAYVSLVAGIEPNAEAAQTILRFSLEHMAPYKRIRRIEFAELPKTISGKIRRVELRRREEERQSGRGGFATEYRDTDFPELRRG